MSIPPRHSVIFAQVESEILQIAMVEVPTTTKLPKWIDGKTQLILVLIGASILAGSLAYFSIGEVGLTSASDVMKYRLPPANAQSFLKKLELPLVLRVSANASAPIELLISVNGGLLYDEVGPIHSWTPVLGLAARGSVVNVTVVNVTPSQVDFTIAQITDSGPVLWLQAVAIALVIIIPSILALFILGRIVRQRKMDFAILLPVLCYAVPEIAYWLFMIYLRLLPAPYGGFVSIKRSFDDLTPPLFILYFLMPDLQWKAMQALAIGLSPLAKRIFLPPYLSLDDPLSALISISKILVPFTLGCMSAKVMQPPVQYYLNRPLTALHRVNHHLIQSILIVGILWLSYMLPVKQLQSLFLLVQVFPPIEGVEFSKVLSLFSFSVGLSVLVRVTHRSVSEKLGNGIARYSVFAPLLELSSIGSIGLGTIGWAFLISSAFYGKDMPETLLSLLIILFALLWLSFLCFLMGVADYVLTRITGHLSKSSKSHFPEPPFRFDQKTLESFNYLASLGLTTDLAPLGLWDFELWSSIGH